MIGSIVANGVPVVISLALVTEPGEGWQGRQFIGSYTNMKDLNAAINSTEVPLYWQLEVDFQDAILDE